MTIMDLCLALQRQKVNKTADFCLQESHFRTKHKNLKITCFYDFMVLCKWKPLIQYQEHNLQST